MPRADELEAPPRLADTNPWAETRPGGLFFITALLASPVLMTLVPVTLRWALRTFAGLDRPSRVLDPVPAVAAYVAPVVGWLALPALLFTLYAAREIDRRWARVLVWAFALVHLGTLAYTISRW
jgi:hypothetical protein